MFTLGMHGEVDNEKGDTQKYAIQNVWDYA